MNNNITFRPTLSLDEQFLREAYASSRDYEVDLVDWDKLAISREAFLDMQFNAQDISYKKDFKKADFLIIMKDEEDIGRLYVDYSEETVKLIDIIIMAKHRNKGIGGEVVGQVLERAGKEKKQVQIYVERLNPALRLYKRLGFEIEEVTDVFYVMYWSKSDL